MCDRLAARALGLALVICALGGVTASGIPASSGLDGASVSGRPDDKKPKLSVKASPSVAFSPARVVVTGEIKGGPNDYEAFYCATVEWDWGDDTTSESSYDCDPYEPGKSELRRRFVSEHVYRTSGSYQIEFRLKKKNKTLAGVRTNIQVRPGVRDIGQARRRYSATSSSTGSNSVPLKRNPRVSPVPASDTITYT